MFKKYWIAFAAVLAVATSIVVVLPTVEATADDGACYGKAYITGSSTNELMIVDTVTNTVDTTLTAGLDSPVGFVISPDGGFGYLANSGSDEILKYDLATNSVVETYSGLLTPYYIGITPDGSKIAVSEVASGANSVAIIDTTSGAMTRVSLSASPFELLINNAGSKIYVAGSNTIWSIDLTTETVLATISTTGSGLGMGITPDDSKVYIAQGSSAGRVDVVDTATDTLLTPIMSTDGPYWITVSPDGSTVWSVLYDADPGQVIRIDTATDTIVATLTLNGVPNPYLSGVTADGSQFYVFGYDPGTNVIDPSTDAVAVAGWTAPGDPWDFRTCPVAVPPAPTTSTTVPGPTTTTAGTDPVVPAFTG